MLEKKIELLAPAGSLESLIAAVEGGCDAVYLGLSSYSARAFAENFSLENIGEVISYCHIRNVRVYVTMNTLVYESEWKGLKKAVDVLYEADVDGILVQDLGLFHYIQQVYPSLPLHCSTQMHIHNVAGVRFMKEQGASRCVVARESSLETIQKMCQQGIEIEVFAYGAICVAYSGQCLMSSSTKNRSANRGACAQNCRLKYKEDGQVGSQGMYSLSPKDLNAIELVPQLIEAGVASLKIEGRMKKPEYVYAVTRAFRKAIDAYYDHKSFHLSQLQEEELQVLFNRGFSLGHLASQNADQRMAHTRPNHQGLHLGKVLSLHGHYLEVQLDRDLEQGDGIRILSHPEDIGFVVNKMENRKGLLTRLAKKGEKIQLYCPEGWPKVGDELRLTSDESLIKDLWNQVQTKQRRIPLKLQFKARVGSPAELVVSDDRKTYCIPGELVCQKALNQALSEERLSQAFSQLTESAYSLEDISFEMDAIFLPMKEIHQLRRRMVDRLNEERSNLNHFLKKKLPYQFQLKNPKYQGERLLVRGIASFPKARYLSNQEIIPVVNEKLEGPSIYSQQVLNEIGNFYGQREHCIAGMGLNISNSYGLAYFLSQPGIDTAILSSELSSIQIRNTLKAFEERYGFMPFVYQFVFGKREVMYIKQGFESYRVKTLSDLQDNQFDLTYTTGEVVIQEAKNFHAKNEYALGSYLILNDQLENANKILEDAYEELYSRI